VIISLGQSFDELDQAGWNKYIVGVQHLIQAHMHGWHVFVPSRRSLAQIESHPILPLQYREAFRVLIAERLASLAGYAGAVSRKIICLRDSEDEYETDEEVGLRLSNFEDLENCFKSKLIVENVESDGIFYTLLTKELFSEGALCVPISLEIVAGGGNTTAGRVGEAVQRPRPSITIVDSDKIYPAAPEGETAQAVRAAFEGRQQVGHRLIVTGVRSLENFIPLASAPEFLEDKVQPLEFAKKLLAWQKNEHDSSIPPSSCVTGYISFKKGMKISAYRKASAEFRQAVVNLLSHLEIDVDLPANDETGRDNEILIPGICKTFANDFVRKFSSGGISGAKEFFISFPFAEEIALIAKDITSYGAATQRVPYRLAA
jgi:hypothetical protein